MTDQMIDDPGAVEAFGEPLMRMVMKRLGVRLVTSCAGNSFQVSAQLYDRENPKTVGDLSMARVTIDMMPVQFRSG